MDKIILGTVQFGLNYGITNNNGKISDIDIDKIFNFCNINNIIYFDTAQDYGTSEDILSKYKKKYNNFKIITKAKFKNKNLSIDELINISINKFENIDYFLLHSFEDYNEEIINNLLKYKNKIDKIKILWWDGQGFCLYYKQLDSGKFTWPKLEEQKTLTITRAQLSMLMEAIDWRNPVRSEGPAYVA